MGNSNNSPDTDTLSLGSRRRSGRGSCPRSEGHADRRLPPAEGPRDRQRRRDHRLTARALHHEDGQGALHQGHGADPDRRLPPLRRDRHGERQALAGWLRRAEEDGRSARLQLVDAGHPNWQRADNNWLKRAARGAGRRRRAEGHPHRVLLRLGLLPVRQDVGRDLRPDRASARSRRRRASRRPATTRSACSARHRDGQPGNPGDAGQSRWPRQAAEALGGSRLARAG